MRRIRKSQPPRDVSPMGQKSRTLIEAEREFLQHLPTSPDKVIFARFSYNALDKKKLRAVMYLEQGGLCIFCERRVREGTTAPHIDHWRPLSHSPELALRWQNLYLSCYFKQTCDSRKKNTPLRSDQHEAELPFPVDVEYQRCVGFTSYGEVYVRADAPLPEGQRDALARALGVVHHRTMRDNGILNLNHPALVKARAAAIDGEKLRLEKKYKGRTASPKDREQEAQNLLQQREMDEFVSIRVRWLDRSLGKAK